MSDPNKRWVCNGCSAMVLEGSMLSAPSPFDEDSTITGCPRCRQCEEGFIELCDEPNCMKQAGCGFPIDGGYRRTCYQHSIWAKEKGPTTA